MSDVPVPLRSHCEADDFKRALTCFASGVTVTTAIDGNGLPRGVTVASFTSVSLAPPMILLCIDHRSQMLGHLPPNGYFGVNILGENQEEICAQFSRNWNGRFENMEWHRGETGVPLLAGAAATLECRTADRIEAGDHIIILGLVICACRLNNPVLVYSNRRYGRFVSIHQP
jgi:flavin reductase (DIM6/NTAB) family NADH-FMN oxidoreductase RutF